MGACAAGWSVCAHEMGVRWGQGEQANQSMKFRLVELVGLVIFYFFSLTRKGRSRLQLFGVGSRGDRHDQPFHLGGKENQEENMGKQKLHVQR